MLGSIHSFSRTTAAASFALGVVCLPTSVARAQLAVEEISIVAGSTDTGSGPEWMFLVEIQGDDLTTVSVLPPIGGAIALEDESMLGIELGFEDGPFASFAELQATYPAGSYLVTVEGSETVSLTWDPTEPLGASGEPTLSIDAPASGSVGVSSMPTLDYTLDCTNCKDLDLEIEDLATRTAELQFGQLDVVGGAFADPIPFAIMSTNDGPPVALPDGPAEAELLVGLASFSDESFDMPTSLPSFEYVEASVLFAQSTFTVPEPAPGGGALVALALVALLARRTRAAPRC